MIPSCSLLLLVELELSGHPSTFVTPRFLIPLPWILPLHFKQREPYLTGFPSLFPGPLGTSKGFEKRQANWSQWGRATSTCLQRLIPGIPSLTPLLPCACSTDELYKNFSKSTMYASCQRILTKGRLWFSRTGLVAWKSTLLLGSQLMKMLLIYRSHF